MPLAAKAVIGGIACLLIICPAARAAQPLAIYVSDLDSNIAGENRLVAQYLSDAIETAFTRRRVAFRLLERRKYNEIIQRNKLEKDLQAFTRGGRPSDRLMEQLHEADGVVAGDLRETRLDGVVLTVSLTRMNLEKVWQAQRKHSLYEWLSSEVRDREAESLAADAATVLQPLEVAMPESEDGPRGIALAAAGKCPEAMPFLRNAAAVDVTNAEIYFHLGKCHNDSGEFAEATRALTGAIARNPHRADLFTERARSFAGRGGALTPWHA